MFWVYLNILRQNNMSRLWTAVSGSPRQFSWFIADKTSDTTKMLLQNRSRRLAVFFRNYVM